jgi:hypothetical protein
MLCTFPGTPACDAEDGLKACSTDVDVIVGGVLERTGTS